jgi:hypothetical protein
LNPNYATTIKQDIDKLLPIGFIQPLEEATWLSPIMVLPKKNGKLRICIDFKKLNKVTKKILIVYHFCGHAISFAVVAGILPFALVAMFTNWGRVVS